MTRSDSSPTGYQGVRRADRPPCDWRLPELATAASAAATAAECVWQDAGVVSAAWLRPDKTVPPQCVTALDAVEGIGIRGDCHADPLSPRQVLIASVRTYARLGLSAATLRETLTVSSPIESWRPGSLVALGPHVLLRLMFRCEPCARLNRHRDGLLRDVGDERGVLARVVRGGTVAVGMPIRIRASTYGVWPDAWQDRIRAIVQAIPDGAVVEYAHLARIAGVPVAYCRVFPKVLADTAGVGPSRAVPSGTRPEDARWTGHEVFLANTPLAGSGTCQGGIIYRGA